MTALSHTSTTPARVMITLSDDARNLLLDAFDLHLGNDQLAHQSARSQMAETLRNLVGSRDANGTLHTPLGFMSGDIAAKSIAPVLGALATRTGLQVDETGKPYSKKYTAHDMALRLGVQTVVPKKPENEAKMVSIIQAIESQFISLGISLNGQGTSRA